MDQVVRKNVSRSWDVPLATNLIATSKISLLLIEMFTGFSDQLSQTCLAYLHEIRECEVVSTYSSHIGQDTLVFTPLLLKLSFVGRAFIQACQANILTFARILRCQNFLHNGNLGSPLDLSLVSLVSNTLRAM